MTATAGGANRMARTVFIEGADGGSPQVHDGAMSVEEYWQSMLHDGTLFRFVAFDADFDTADGAKNYLIKVGGITDGLHMRASVSASQATTVALFESPTVTVVGTLQTLVNAHRGSALTATGVTVYLTPTTTADGTTLETIVFGANTGGSRFGGAATTGEFILAANTDYLFRVTTLASDSVISISLAFALHDDGLAPTTTTTTTTTT